MRGIPAEMVSDLSGDAPAREAFAGAPAWVVVMEETALPAAMTRFPVPGPERVLVAATEAETGAQTLRELEVIAPQRSTSAEAASAPAAICFRPADFPATPEETVAEYLARLRARADRRQGDPDLRAFRLEDAPGEERPELTRHVPPGARRVLEGDASRVLDGLAHGGEPFDAFLFAGVLENLEDPAGLLLRARSRAAAGATLIASVPNAGSLSFVRDLVLGRFDPAASGLAQASRLRWFTKASLAEMLEEAGWRVVSIEPWKRSPAPRSEEFLERLSALPGLDRASLEASRWIAVAVPAVSPAEAVTVTSVADDPITRSPDRPMLRIAYLLESTEVSGGVKVVLQQAEALARRGHRVAVVSPRAQPGWFPMSRARFERSSFRESRELAEADIRVATFWTTVAPAMDGARGPVFHLCQGYEGAFSFYAHQREEIEAAYAMPTRKLAISKTLASRLEGLGFGPAENVGQCFDAGEFRPASEMRASPTIPALLLVGPYEADVKGIGIGLEALRIWRERGGVFRLRRISTQPITDEERAAALPGEYHHDLPPRRMPFAYRACDVFLGPNRAEEGFGLPALEALASGLPCLLSNTPGHREIAGEAAWYFSDGDAVSMAAALPDLTTSEARARARSEGPRAASRFDTGRVAASLESAFERRARRGTGSERMTPDVSAIVVSHRSAAEAARCIASLSKSFAEEGIAGEVVLVDCGSGEGEQATLRGIPADLHVLLPENRGYSGGVNAGLARAGGARLLLSNADVVFSAGSVGRLLGAIADPRVGAAGPLSAWDAEGRLRLPPGHAPGLFRDAAQLLAGLFPALDGRRFAAFARETSRLWERGGRVRHLSGAVLAGAPRRLRRCGPVRRAIPVRVRRNRMGRPGPLEGIRSALRSAGSRPPPLGGELLAKPGDRRAPRRLRETLPAPAVRPGRDGDARESRAAAALRPLRGRPFRTPLHGPGGRRRRPLAESLRVPVRGLRPLPGLCPAR